MHKIRQLSYFNITQKLDKSKYQNISYFIIFLYLCLIISACRNEESDIISQKTEPEVFENKVLRDSIIKEIKSYILKHNCPGLSVAFTLDGKKYTKYNFGTKDTDTRESNIDNKTLFRIGSVSKGFTGILASVLIEKGYFKLNDAIVKYIPEFKMKARVKNDSIRIWHVLSHCTGLTEHAYSNLIEQNFSRERILQNLYNTSVRDSIGKKYAYQNAAYGIIEVIIEKTTKLSFENALDKYIFQPLKMDSTNVGYNALTTSINHTKPHRIYSNGQYSSFTPDEAYYNIPSAGGINSTLNDMTIWLRTLINDGNTLLPKTAVDMALKPYIDSSWDDRYFNQWNEVAESGYGLGWRNLIFNGESLSFHGGQVNQYRTEIVFNREQKYGLIALFNSTCGYSSEIVPHVINIIQGSIEDQNCL